MIDLNPNHFETVRAILAEHALECEVRAFRSRATWTAKDYSDLDLAVVGVGSLDWKTLGRLKEAFEESDLPMRVDVLDWHTISERFHRQIQDDYVVVQESTNRTLADERREIPFSQLLAEPVRNGVYKKKEFHGRGVKVVNMGELFAYPRLRDVDMRRVELSESEQHRFSVQAGDLLFARRSLVAEGAGKCSVVLEINEPTAFESSIIRARLDPRKADALFLYYYFNSPIGLHALDTIRRQVAVAGITGTDLAQLPVEVPPLAEQRSIAHVLGTLDDKIELNRRMNETLEEMARALFKSWFVDFDPVRAKMEGRWQPGESLPGLPADLYDLFPDRLVPSELREVPDGWGVKGLGDCFNLTMGQSPPGSTYNDDGNGTPFYQGSTDFGERYPTNRRHCTEPARLAQTEDTLVSVRAPVGAINRAWERCCIGRGVAALRHKSGSAPYTYYAIWAAQSEIGQYEHTGTVFGAIGGQQFKALLMLEPPEETIAEFHRIGQDLDRRIRSKVAESRALAMQRDAALPKLVSGEARVGDVT